VILTQKSKIITGQKKLKVSWMLVW